MADGISERLRAPSSNVRKAAAVDAARAGDLSAIDALVQLAQCDAAQDVRREAASAVGRLSRHAPQAFAALVELSQHPDPGVVIQAARGLIAARAEVQRAIADPILEQLAKHPNEILREFVLTERSRAASISNSSSKRGGGGGGG